MKNSNLSKAKAEKNDEFYTRLEDIEIELSHYPAKYFKDKTIYLPCDVVIDGTKVPKSNFVKYFQINRVSLGYKKLIATSINNTKNLYILEQDGREFYGYCPEDSEYVSGDYRSEYCQKLFKEADVVVTNPPFSLFRDFVACLEKHDLKYCIVGNQNAITYKEIFSLIRDSKLWLGAGFKGNVGFFSSPYKDIASASEHREGQIRVSGAAWFTNIDFNKRHEDILLVNQYNEKDYPKYDNYDAIEVSKTKDIPYDYNGIMGVPITFLYKYNPDQFEIIGLGTNRELYMPNKTYVNVQKHLVNGITKASNEINSTLAIGATEEQIQGKVYYTAENVEGYLLQPYARILIRRKQQEVQ